MGIKFRFGFTLAEVLITLGIVGIIAAITLPSLITNYKVKLLKTSFKNTDAIISQALLKMGEESGYDIAGLALPGRSGNDKINELKGQISNINDIWLKQFTGLTQITKNDLRRKGIYMCNNFWVNSITSLEVCYGDGNDIYILPNGASVTKLSVLNYGVNDPALVAFMFDTNGPFKGPNRLGYDIFRYISYEYSTDSLCDLTTQHSENGRGCYYYAHRGLNPIDSSKSYWDILYKPKSYWENK